LDPILHIMITVAIIALICYLVLRFVPMPEPFDKIIIAVAVIGTVLYLLSVFGLFHLNAH